MQLPFRDGQRLGPDDASNRRNITMQAIRASGANLRRHGRVSTGQIISLYFVGA